MNQSQIKEYNLTRGYKKCNLCKQSKRTTSKKERFFCKACRGAVLRLNQSKNGVHNFPTNGKIDFDLILLINFLYDHKDYSIKQIISEIDIPSSTIYTKIKSLEVENIVNHKDLLYYLTLKGNSIILNLREGGLTSQYLINSHKDNRYLRFHKLQGSYNVSEPIANFEQYLNKPLKFGTGFFLGRNKSKKGLKFVVNSCIIIVYNEKSISVTFPDIIIPEVTEEGVGKGYVRLGEIIDNLAEELQKRFRGLVIDSFRPFNLNERHIAISNSRYAKKYFEKHGGHLIEEGIHTDKSHGLFELEADDSYAGQKINECIKREQESSQNIL